jgi:hypothetical protein
MYKPVAGAERQQASPAVQAMLDWAQGQGVRWPKIYYPVLFPPGYIGSIATDDIFPNETIVSAPNPSLFTTQVVRESDLKPIIDSNPSLFDPDSGYYSDFLLCSFLISEKAKGVDSAWHEFIGYQPASPSNLQDWSSAELAELQDADLVFDTVKSREYHAEAHARWKTVLEKYPETFTEQMLSLAEYTWAIRLVGTRTFGKFAPYVTFFPVGELLNHDNVESFYAYGRPDEQADSSKRYNGRVDDEDHDGWLYEEVDSVELNNQLLTVMSYMLNDKRDDEDFDRLREMAETCDLQSAEEEKSRKVYRPDDIDLAESAEKEMKIVAGPNEHYEKGSEVYMSYGRYSNRQLLGVYGFALKVNKYNFAEVKIPISALGPESIKEKVKFEDLSMDSLVRFKLKENVLCQDIVKLIRKLNWRLGMPRDAFFKARIIGEEVKALSRAIKILQEKLNSFATTIEEDREILSGNIELKKYFAVLYRLQRKEIIRNQIEFHEAARNVIAAARSTNELHEMYEKEILSYANIMKFPNSLHSYFLELNS